MGILDNLLLRDELNKPSEQPVAAPPSNWLKDVIDKRYQPKTERLKRNPVGFEFKREPFDPSSYYRALGMYKDISRGATAVSQQQEYNRQQRETAASNSAAGNAMGGVAANFVYNGSGKSRKYKLGGVSPNTAAAADYFGSKYDIGNIGGYRDHGSVPGSDHPKGRALDYMTSNRKKGDALANDLLRNHKKWNVKYVIWNRYIWSPGRGWRKYNGPSSHTDHVHASFNK